MDIYKYAAMTPELAGWLFDREVNITGKLNIGDPTDQEQIRLQGEMIGRDERAARVMIEKIDVIQAAGYTDPLFRLQNLIRSKNIGLVPQYYGWCLIGI